MQGYLLLLQLARSSTSTTSTSTSTTTSTSTYSTRWEGRGDSGEAKLVRMLEKKPDKLLAALLVEEEEVAVARAKVLGLLSRRATLATLTAADTSLLARACAAREEVVDMVVRVLTRELEGEKEGVVERVGRVVVELVASPLYPHSSSLLTLLDTRLAKATAFTRWPQPHLTSPLSPGCYEMGQNGYFHQN